MKAIVCRNYGSAGVLTREELEKPAAGKNEFPVKVRADVEPMAALRDTSNGRSGYRGCSTARRCNAGTCSRL